MKRIYTLLIYVFLVSHLAGQVPVHEEPLHHVIYEDEEIRILEIEAIPGDTSLVHRHDYNYCYIATQGGRLWLEDLGEQSREVNLPTHYAGGKFELSEGPFVHRFANIDTSNISFFTVEHKLGIPRIAVAQSLPEDAILKDSLFVLRKLELEALSGLQIPHKGTVILLNLSKSALLFTGAEPISYWKRFDAKDACRISNMHKEAISVAIFEIY